MSTIEKAVVTEDKPVSKWTYKDFTWVLSLFGTAVGQAFYSYQLKLVLGVLAISSISNNCNPMIWLAHKGLARFVLSSKSKCRYYRYGRRAFW